MFAAGGAYGDAVGFRKWRTKNEADNGGDKIAFAPQAHAATIRTWRIGADRQLRFSCVEFRQHRFDRFCLISGRLQPIAVQRNA